MLSIMPLTCTNEDHLDLTTPLAKANVLPISTAGPQGPHRTEGPTPSPRGYGDKGLASRLGQAITSHKRIRIA